MAPKANQASGDSLSCQAIIRKRAPTLADSKAEALALIWDEVAQAVIQAMLAHENGIERELHINIKAEMALELAKLTLLITDKVVEKRTADRDIATIDAEAERLACLGPEGVVTIANTARIFYDHVWRRFLEERWVPKSRKAIERDAAPARPAKLSIKPVRDKHFISRWFIRDFWASGPKATRWRKGHDAWSRREIPFGRWGYRQELWGDQLEAYFALLEGDAKKPIQMLLDMQPLNQPQQLAFIAHLVIHQLRNPRFISTLRTGLKDMHEETAREMGASVDDVARRLYETLYQSNELYDRSARPLLWSQWAIVASSEPVFVLPDTFCARGNVAGESRLVVPLTPHKCFVTLAEKETEKRVVPYHLTCDDGLARRISNLLIRSAVSEFLSDERFSPEAGDGAADFSAILRDIKLALNDKAR